MSQIPYFWSLSRGRCRLRVRVGRLDTGRPAVLLFPLLLLMPLSASVPALPRLLPLPRHGAADLGWLAVAEAGALPFAVARVYWTYLTPETVMRGHHAHRTLQQVLFAVAGRLEISLESADGQRQAFELCEPHVGLYVPAGYWRTIRFREAAVLLCLASEPYHEDSYMFDYDEFRALSVPAPAA